jgi:Tol biopolymer transport system component
MLPFSILLTLGASPLLFGDEEVGWYVMNEAGEVLQRFADFAGERATEAAVSPDGTAFVFVTVGPGDSRRLLTWHTGEAKARALTPAAGFYAHPSFSPDGWVYFTHNGSGPPGEHQPGMNAQVFRVRLDGSHLEQLTTSHGCKLAPASAKAKVIYLHSTCQRTAGAESMPVERSDGGSQQVRAFGEAGWNAVELAATRDGRRVAVVESRTPGAVVYEYSTTGAARPKMLAQFEFYPRPMQPQWGQAGDALFVKAIRDVWKLPRSGKPVRLSTLGEAQDESPPHGR